MITKFILIILMLVFIMGCNELKRFRSANVFEASKPNEHVSVSLFSTESETEEPKKSSSKTLWELQGEGQAAFIQRFSETTVDKEKLTAALSQEFLKDENVTTQDFTKKNVRIILSVSKTRDYNNQFNNYTPADRIEYLKLCMGLVGITNGYPKFIKWNRFETKFDTIKIADVTFERTIDTKASAKLGNDESKSTAGIDLGVTNKRTVAETIRYRYVSLNGILTPDHLEIEEEGNREIDLNDNITLDFIIEFEKKPGNFVVLKDLFDSKTSKANPADKAGLSISYFYMPDFAANAPLKATIDFDYLFRHVLNDRGIKTYPEYDDKVSLIKGKGQTRNIELLSADEIKPKRWKIVVVNGVNTAVLHVFNSSISALDVQFSDYYAASDFVRWLKTYPAGVDSEPLKIGDMNFSEGANTRTVLTKKYFKDNSDKIEVIIEP